MPARSTPDILLDALASGAGPQTLWDVSTGWLHDLGFDRVICLTVPAENQMPEIRTTMPDNFLKTYHDEQFAKDDPFLTYCLPSKTPVPTGIAYLDTHSYLSQREAGLIEVAAAAGFNAGYSVSLPASGPFGAVGWNLGSSQSRKEVEQVRRHHDATILLFLIALQGRLSTAKDNLTPREVVVMQLLTEGLRTKEIALQLQISRVTAEFHLTNARRKLGAPTRESAVARFLLS